MQTPAFIINAPELQDKAEFLRKISQRANIKLLYSLKANGLVPLVTRILPFVDGLSASSLFEVRLGQHILKQGQGLGQSPKEIHVYSPAYTKEELRQLSSSCHQLSFNSLTQWELFQELLREEHLPSPLVSLRINPQFSSGIDTRFDPCRNFSKLGIPLDVLKEKKMLSSLHGLHLHTTCENNDFSYFFQLVQKLHQEIPHLLSQIKEINLGGGYLFQEATNLEIFFQALDFLRSRYALEFIIEPGTDFVQDHIHLLTKVLDIAEVEGKKVAILDTTINHVPEVFEFQYRPDVAEEQEEGEFSYLLAGRTCLAGDIFGEYRFERPLQVGSDVLFKYVGSYSLSKANFFNGLNLPSLYFEEGSGQFFSAKSYSFEDFFNLLS